MTSKERAALRAQANGLDVMFQYGKGGISDNLIEAVNGVLDTRELIKIRVLTETSPDTARQAADKLSEATGADVIQVIGGVVVLYRRNEELHKNEKKKPVAKKTTVYEYKVNKKQFDDRKKRVKASAAKRRRTGK